MRQLYEYHPVFAYRYIPHLKARIAHEGGGYLLRANEAGFRSERPFAAPRTPGMRRVLFFGDSFTAGDGVANAQRYTDLLEQRIAGLETYNFAVSSTGTDQQYLTWRECARDIEHDVIVIAVFVENIRRIVARYRPHRDAQGVERLYAKPYYTLGQAGLTLHQVPPQPDPVALADMSPQQRAAIDTGGRMPLLRSVVTALGAREIMQKMSHYQPLPQYSAPDGEGWQLMRAILSQWIRAQRRPVVLMPLPLPQHLDQVCDAGPYQQRFAELAGELGCVLHDPLPALLAHDAVTRRAFRWKQDIHFTPAGHQALAATLEPVLRRLIATPAAIEESSCPN